MLVVHYTGMESCEAALARLCAAAAQVSAHYVIDEDGTVYALQFRKASTISWAGKGRKQ